MAGSSIECGIKEYKKLKKKLDAVKKAPETVQKRLIGDFKSRAPSWIAKEVVKVYNINRKEITPTKEDRGKKKIGTISVKGKTVASISLVYRGRVLTPTHFKMSPKTPPDGAYTLKVQILKQGGKKTLGKIKKLTKKQRKNIGRNFTGQGTQNSPKSPIMLMSTGAKGEDKVSHIPFQRMSQRRSDIEPKKTLSMPQMVSNEKTQKGIDDVLSANVGKRLTHYLDRYMPD